MDLELFEMTALESSFGFNIPEELDGTLDSISPALTCSFNRHGSLIAIGCNDGRIVIWDFTTRALVKAIPAHAYPICCVHWSRSGHKIISASTDNNVCIWNVLDSTCIYRFRFHMPSLRVQFNPRDDNQFLAIPMRSAPMISKIGFGLVPLPMDGQFDFNIVACYDRRGAYIYTGNASGKLLIIDTQNYEIVSSFRVGSGIRSIEVARRGDSFLVCGADRIIRVYDCNKAVALNVYEELQPISKLQDLVNKSAWRKCCFSGDGEYVCAGSARQHSIYIWDKTLGTLVKILNGSKSELMLDLIWHPARPIILSVSSGIVSVWARPAIENWSSFQPDFKELDENIEYEERESEFDIDDEDKSVKLDEDEKEEDNESNIVDVENVKFMPLLCSSDEEEGCLEEPLLYLPITPIIELPEEDNESELDELSVSDIISDGNFCILETEDDLDNVPCSSKKSKILTTKSTSSSEEDYLDVLVKNKNTTKKKNNATIRKCRSKK